MAFQSLYLISALLLPNSPQAKPIDFTNDVVPVLTRAGCNVGTCHGAAAGKNGFHLSLRGYAPEIDHYFLTRQAGGRRVCRTEPAKSLILTKPMMEMPHMGGLAVKKDSPEYRILARWLEEGAVGPLPTDRILKRIAVTPEKTLISTNGRLPLKVMATFTDGSTQDITHWSRFGTNNENIAIVNPDGAVKMVGRGETTIMVGYQDKVTTARVTTPYANKVDGIEYTKLPRANFVDGLIYNKLESLNLMPGGRASDATFCRRLFMDLTGTLPQPKTIQAFIASRDTQKRVKLVDQLMNCTEFNDFWTYKWCDLFRVNRGTMKDKGVLSFYSWIHDSVRDNKPWSDMAREVLTARGNTFLDGPANYFRTALKPEELSENIAQGFLGIRVGCAKCHNHPLEKWTQNEYYGMANIFARVKFKADLGIYVNNEMTIYNSRDGDVIQPRLGKAIPPQPLGGPRLANNPTKDRRELFADWLTSPTNTYFPKVIVNRVWAHLMGRGIVDPVDDLRDTNPPSNPELLDSLSQDFVKHNYDLRHLMKVIITSEAYQRESMSSPRNVQDDRYYSRYYVKRLTAEQLLDALCQVTGNPEQFPDMPLGFRALQLPDTHVKSDFLDSFGRPARQITCECERSQEPSMSQALLFISGDLINHKVGEDGGIVEKLIKSGKSNPEIVETLYWTALGRAPRTDERKRNKAAMGHADKSVDALQHAKARRSELEDMLWVLVNSKEFLFNH